MSKQLMDTITGIDEIAEDIFRIKVFSEYISANAVPGQFVNIKCCEGNEALLRRPISICDVNRKYSTYDIVLQKKGNGTELLARKKAGDSIDVIGPLGNGFDMGIEYRRVAVVGGGIGIFPLLFLINESRAIVKRAYLGFRTSNLVVLEDEFKQKANSLEISTDDGSYGSKGFATDVLKRDLSSERFDLIYACGPEPMLRIVSQIAQEFDIQCQVSLEQRMGCGFGTCLACACKTVGDEDEEWKYSHVCKDGPVFDSKKIIFE